MTKNGSGINLNGISPHCHATRIYPPKPKFELVGDTPGVSGKTLVRLLKPHMFTIYELIQRSRRLP